MKDVLLSALILIAAAAPLRAQDNVAAGHPDYVGVPSSQFPGLVTDRQTPESLWAACVQMVLNYHGIPVTQSEIGDRGWGGDATDIRPKLHGQHAIVDRFNGWRFEQDGLAWNIRAKLWPDADPGTVILGQLAAGKPVIVGYGDDPDNCRVIVITSAGYEDEHLKPSNITHLVIRDPYPNRHNRATAGRQEYANGVLPARIQWIWVLDGDRA